MSLFKALLHSIIIVLLLVSQTSYAQTVISPVLPDSILATEDSITSISCDMLYCPDASLRGQLIAVAYSYDKANSNKHESMLQVKYIDTNGTTVSWSQKVPLAYNMDVVLGDNKLTTGSKYKVFFVYNQDSAGYPLVKWSRYTLGVSASGYYSVNNGGGTTLGLGLEPKVDVFPKATDTFNNGTPKMYDFAATWISLDSNLHLFTGYVNSGNQVAQSQIYMGKQIVVFDIAAQYDLDSARYVAHILYPGDVIGKNWITHMAINMSANPPAILSTDTLISDTVQGSKHRGVEAVGLYKRNTGGASWGAIMHDKRSPTTTEILHYNSLNNYGYVLTPSLLPGQHCAASIAVGLGLTKDTNKIGNENFVVGWQDPTANNYYSQYVNLRTGLRDSPNDYYDICSTSTTEYMALSSSSNSGNKILAAWWDGTDIYWKLTGNTTGYKPAKDDDERNESVSGGAITVDGPITGTGQAGEQQRLLSKERSKARVYPNPAKNLLYVDGYKGANYRIADAMGRIMLSGVLNGSAIDLRELANGCYVIQIEGAGIREAVRFNKY